MVLLGRIELPTSSLPMTRSTTELQQRSISCSHDAIALRSRAYGGVDRPCQGDLRRSRQFAYARAMAETQDQRQARLAQALRTNLRRRKAQTREGAGDAPPPPAPDSPEG